MRAVASFQAGRQCAYAPCQQLLVVKTNESAFYFNRRTHCDRMCARRNTVSSGRPLEPTRHGTVSGYRKCHKLPGGACDPCRAAQSQDMKERAASGEYQRRRAARERALRELAARYPTDFEALLEKELAA